MEGMERVVEVKYGIKAGKRVGGGGGENLSLQSVSVIAFIMQDDESDPIFFTIQLYWERQLWSGNQRVAVREQQLCSGNVGFVTWRSLSFVYLVNVMLCYVQIFNNLRLLCFLLI